MSGFELRNSDAESLKFRLRVWVVALVVLLMFGLLVFRLFTLQVVRHDAFAERAESNRTAVVTIVPPPVGRTSPTRRRSISSTCRTSLAR